MAQPTKVLGLLDPNILAALWANLVSWFVHTLVPASLVPFFRLLPAISQEEGTVSNGTRTTSSVIHHHQQPVMTTTGSQKATPPPTRCIVIGRPGGVEQLRLIQLKPGIATCGYNLEGQDIPFTKPLFTTNTSTNTSTNNNEDDINNDHFPPDCVLVNNQAFSVNYADCCIRWGLYESANAFCGFPICPGFDLAGVVERIGAHVTNIQVGDRVFGCSLFGSYSTRVLVPALHVRTIPLDFTFAQAASIPTVALTSLYALYLAGHYPTPSPFTNRAILIHSAAGGVGGMLVQMSKLLRLSPIVGVVGRTNKVETAEALGCDVVIDASQGGNLWEQVRLASPGGYSTVMDSSGVATIKESYEHLTPTGRLIVFGFHSNLPLKKDSLSPLDWMRMGLKMGRMPRFDPMEMGTSNKGVLAFNLSFFSKERDMLSNLFSQILTWLENGQLQCPRVHELPMSDIREAHALIQSGTTVGKIVLTTADA